MKGLFLYGANCSKEVWIKMKDSFIEYDIVYADYPHEITSKAKSVSEITKWIYGEYGNEKFDFIVGHSLGGIIALELLSKYNCNCSVLIFIESNLKPAEKYYRNLMTEENMKIHGENVLKMIKKEEAFYNVDLFEELKGDFDYTDYIKNNDAKIFGIYGDRGIPDYKYRESDLCLEDDIVKNITFKYISNACHMPMIENSDELTRVILEIVQNN